MKKINLITIIALPLSLIACKETEDSTSKNDEKNSSLVVDASLESAEKSEEKAEMPEVKETDDSKADAESAAMRDSVERRLRDMAEGAEGGATLGGSVGNLPERAEGGAVLGGVIGHQSGRALEGAAIGAAAGVAAGASIGGVIETEEDEEEEKQE